MNKEGEGQEEDWKKKEPGWKRREVTRRQGRQENLKGMRKRKLCHSSRCFLFSLHSFFYWTFKTSLGDPLSWLCKMCSKITESITRRKQANPGVGKGCMVHVKGKRQQWEKPACKDHARAAACFARHSTFQTEALLLRACHRHSWLKVLVSEKEREQSGATEIAQPTLQEVQHAA